MNVKKYTNNTWREITPYKYGTSVETYTDLPQIIYANGNSASIVLKGALSQSGVPTPTTPIQPSGCGDLETTGVHAGQYKIPISSAGQTTSVYLGEVETTRKIKKYEFTGQESIYADLQYSRFIFTLNDSLIIGVRKTPAFCTHWQVIDDGRTIANVPNNALYSDSENSRWFINTTDYTTAYDFKSYLAAQYAAGTPVTVWYVLAEPTTGIVNEPLRKIGDYADEVSGITIPTIAGANTISVDTQVQPSEVGVNYKGWHPVADVHEKSKNLFDKDKRTNNSRVVYTTGEIGTLNGTFVSDFTPIEPNTTYTLNIVSSISGKTGHLFALYDENKDFVNTGTHEATSTTVYTFTTPSNVAYIRFNGDMSSVDSTMLNSSSTALPYEPYWT